MPTGGNDRVPGHPEAEHRLQEDLTYIRKLVARGGPEPAEYPRLSVWFTDVMHRHRAGAITDTDRKRLWDASGEAFTPKTIQGLAARKPHGYPGDYELIDRIYTRWTSPVDHLRRWDEFVHTRAGAQALRNRKSYFLRLVDRVAARSSDPVRVLSVASGPARDVFEYLEQPNKDGTVVFDCVDQDPDAVRYARQLCSCHRDCVNFKVANAFRKLPDHDYDLIWAGGFLDYLPDRLFVLMLRRLARRLKPGGELAVGNFSPENPTRDYMEFAEWSLMYRTRARLLELAGEASLSREATWIDCEESGINLFMHTRG